MIQLFCEKRKTCLSVRHVIGLFFASNLVSITAVADQVEVAPIGSLVEIKAKPTSTNHDYVLETQAKLVQGEEWAPLLQMKGSAGGRSYVDALCGTLEQRYFRLRKLLDAPPVEVANFRLIDTSGSAHELYYQSPSKAVAILLVGKNHETAVGPIQDLAAIKSKFPQGELVVWAVSVSLATERDAIGDWAKKLPSLVPVLQDESGAVHRTLGSGKSPELVLVSTLDWSVAYRGPVAEVLDTGKGTVRNPGAQEAIEELLADKAVSVSRLAVNGFDSGVHPVGSVSYSRDVAPILIQSCMPCHRVGDIAPWSMTNHTVVQQFSRLMKSSLLAGNMPPWHADPKHESFVNAKSLSPDNLSKLIQWIDQGTPRGDGPDLLAEDAAAHNQSDEWPLGKPDAVVSIAAQEIPATGTVDYRYLFATSPFPNDVWLRAVDVKPGDRSVVHHCLVFKGSVTELLALRGGLAGFFAGYVPGMEQVPFPSGTGKLLKKGEMIVFQMHYTTSGKEAVDQTQLGLYVAPTKPARELVTSAAYNTSFTIPPKTKDHPVNASRTFAKKSVIYELSPHMHYRGSRAKFTLAYPDGRREVILNVPRYFFDWQALYRFEKPKEVPAGTVLICDGGFDNSALNRFNPDPAAQVKFGEQSWEEMFIGYVNFAEVQ